MIDKIQYSITIGAFSMYGITEKQVKKSMKKHKNPKKKKKKKKIYIYI